jgi:CDP-glucose 4,6-dehydratase
MEGLVNSEHPAPLALSGKRVLVTGHTGFKGAWLCEWLLQAGARVHGVALPPEAPGSLYNALQLPERLEQDFHVDIRNLPAVVSAVQQASPELVFHLAAQALVRRSYREPLLTWETNVTGTLNVLEALRGLDKPVTAVVVTSDKVYRNREWEFSYRECDELGGHDPYSASKAACELAVDSWRASFGPSTGVRVVTARAGNVVGPGDFSEDRIIPDCYRAWSRGAAVELRNPAATRPWQHVLEPLSGYVALASHVHSQEQHINTCNFGPGAQGDCSVQQLVSRLAALRTGRSWSAPPQTNQPHEARALALSIDRAVHVLDWTPLLTFEETIDWIEEGYAAPAADLPAIVRRQLSRFIDLKGGNRR